MNDINTIIDDEFLASLNPCTDRYENYLSHYSGKTFSVEEFIALENITPEDKFWVLFNEHFLTIPEMVRLACDFAEHVLYIFESKYPGDLRPRDALNLATAAYPDADRAAYAAEAEAAATAAGAAAYAATAAGAAAYADAYAAVAADAAGAAAGAAAAAAAGAAAAAAAEDAASVEEFAWHAADLADMATIGTSERKYQVDLIVKLLKGIK